MFLINKEGMKMKFENKVVVLTGGVKGIGRCIKETF